MDTIDTGQPPNSLPYILAPSHSLSSDWDQDSGLQGLGLGMGMGMAIGNGKLEMLSPKKGLNKSWK